MITKKTHPVFSFANRLQKPAKAASRKKQSDYNSKAEKKTVVKYRIRFNAGSAKEY